MTEAMPFLQKYDITFLRPPTIMAGHLSPSFLFYYLYVVRLLHINFCFHTEHGFVFL